METSLSEPFCRSNVQENVSQGLYFMYNSVENVEFRKTVRKIIRITCVSCTRTTVASSILRVLQRKEWSYNVNIQMKEWVQTLLNFADNGDGGSEQCLRRKHALELQHARQVPTLLVWIIFGKIN